MNFNARYVSTEDIVRGIRRLTDFFLLEDLAAGKKHTWYQRHQKWPLRVEVYQKIFRELRVRISYVEGPTSIRVSEFVTDYEF